MGTAEVTAADTTFTGGERRVWVNIYRVNKSATDSAVKDYIVNKPNFANVTVYVKEIPNENSSLKSFLVIAPLDKKDLLYDPSFWPKNVGIRRFDFNRHRDFLDQAGSFLD